MIPLVKIESLKKSKKKGFYDVETSIGKYSISENIIVKFTILKEKEFTSEEFEKIISLNDDEKVFNNVLNYISYQMRTEAEIRKYLEKKEVREQYITKCIKELKNLGYIDDESYAKYLLSDIQKKNKGPKYLQQKMKEKGLNEKLIKEFVFKYSPDSEEEILTLEINSLKDKNSNLPVKKQKQRLMEKFIRDGFSQTIVFNVINHCDFTFNDNGKLQNDLDKILNSLNKDKYKDISSYELKNKVITKLLQKGYEYSDIKELIKDFEF